MKFIVGIGNPDEEYEKTRHNVGFAVVDEIYIESGLSESWKRNFQAKIVRHGENFLVKPQTYVNSTGESVQAIVREHRLKLQDLLIVCDDINLEFGKLRLRESGSAGGHHGLESIIEHLGSDEFPRLRVGVGNDKMPKDLTSFVLEEFSAAEKKKLGKILEKAVLVCETWINEDFESARDRLSQLQSIK